MKNITFHHYKELYKSKPERISFIKLGKLFPDIKLEEHLPDDYVQHRILYVTSNPFLLAVEDKHIPLIEASLSNLQDVYDSYAKQLK